LQLDRIKYLKLFFIILAGFFFIFSARKSYAKNPVGIVWRPPNDLTEVHDELDLFQKSGVDYLVINKEVRPAVMDILNNYPFHIYVSIPNRFLTTSDLQNHFKQIFERCQNYIKYYDQYSTVDAYGLFEYGQIQSPYFVTLIQPLISRLRKNTTHPFFYLSNRDIKSDVDQILDFKILRLNNGLSDTLIQNISATNIYVTESNGKNFNVRNLERLFKKAQEYHNPTLFFSSDWLFSLYERHIQIFDYIAALSHNPNSLFSTKVLSKTAPASNWLVILLLLVWCITAVHYAFEPTYRKSIQRFFYNHNFFVNDVIERHTRLSTSGLIVLLVQSLIGGMFFYAIAQYSFSQLGYEALVNHYPFLGFLAGHRISLLFIGFASVLIYNLICITWLYFGIYGINYYSQAVTLQAWTQHINVINLSIIITLIMSHSPAIPIYFFSLVFILNILLSFYTTVFDTIKLTDKPYLQHLYTTLPYTITLIGMMVWILIGTHFIQVCMLALSLS